MFLSFSLPSAKPSKPEQTLTRRLLVKKPVSASPISRKPFAFRRPFGLGFNNLLKGGKIELGIAPRDEALGGGWGGSAVGGGGWEGLNTLYSNRPKAYASAAAGSDLGLC